MKMQVRRKPQLEWFGSSSLKPLPKMGYVMAIERVLCKVSVMQTLESRCRLTDATLVKNVTPTYPLPARGYDLPTRRDSRWKAVVSGTTPTVLRVVAGITLLIAGAATLVVVVCFGMMKVASDSRRRNDHFVTGLILGFGLGWLATRSYREGSEDQNVRR